jgi:hypothetical protein
MHAKDACCVLREIPPSLWFILFVIIYCHVTGEVLGAMNVGLRLKNMPAHTNVKTSMWTRYGFCFIWSFCLFLGFAPILNSVVDLYKSHTGLLSSCIKPKYFSNVTVLLFGDRLCSLTIFVPFHTCTMKISGLVQLLLFVCYIQLLYLILYAGAKYRCYMHRC